MSLVKDVMSFVLDMANATWKPRSVTVIPCQVGEETCAIFLDVLVLALIALDMVTATVPYMSATAIPVGLEWVAMNQIVLESLIVMSVVFATQPMRHQFVPTAPEVTWDAIAMNAV